jgi:hypothetical protein
MQAAELVQCSRQRAYTWVEKNRHQLVSIAKARHGGMTYLGRANPHLTERRRDGGGDGSGELTVGSHLTVSHMALSNGQIVLTLETATGEQVKAVLA